MTIYSYISPFLCRIGVDVGEDKARERIKDSFRHLIHEVPAATHDSRLWSKLDVVPEEGLEAIGWESTTYIIYIFSIYIRFPFNIRISIYVYYIYISYFHLLITLRIVRRMCC